MTDPHDSVSTMRVRITPYDGGWKMGEDLVVTVSSGGTTRDLADAVRVEKGIHPSRMRFSAVAIGVAAVSPSKQSCGTEDTRAIPTEEWGRPLSDFGVRDGSSVVIEPPLTGCWMWHDIEYYREKTVQRLVEAVRGKEEDGVDMEELKRAVPFPPPMVRDKFVPFVRMHADLFYVETHTDTGEMWVRPNKSGYVPVWF